MWCAQRADEPLLREYDASRQLRCAEQVQLSPGLLRKQYSSDRERCHTFTALYSRTVAEPDAQRVSTAAQQLASACLLALASVLQR